MFFRRRVRVLCFLRRGCISFSFSSKQRVLDLAYIENENDVESEMEHGSLAYKINLSRLNTPVVLFTLVQNES